MSQDQQLKDLGTRDSSRRQGLPTSWLPCVKTSTMAARWLPGYGTRERDPCITWSFKSSYKKYIYNNKTVLLHDMVHHPIQGESAPAGLSRTDDRSAPTTSTDSMSNLLRTVSELSWPRQFLSTFQTKIENELRLSDNDPVDFIETKFGCSYRCRVTSCLMWMHHITSWQYPMHIWLPMTCLQVDIIHLMKLTSWQLRPDKFSQYENVWVNTSNFVKNTNTTMVLTVHVVQPQS